LRYLAHSIEAAMQGSSDRVSAHGAICCRAVASALRSNNSPLVAPRHSSDSSGDLRGWSAVPLATKHSLVQLFGAKFVLGVE